MAETKQTRIGAWKKETSKGPCVQFAINGQKYTMWPNKFKEGNQPDYHIIEDNYVPKEKPAENLPF